MEKIAVLGAGSWGTTLSQVLSDRGAPVVLWAREEEVRESIAKRRVNETFLPGIVLSEKITPEASIRAAVEGADFIVSVIPSHGVRGVFSEAYAVAAPERRSVELSDDVRRRLQALGYAD